MNGIRIAPLLRVERTGRVLVVTMSRAPVNALNDELIAQLGAAADIAIGDDAISVLHIRSDQRAFSAGADLALIRACFATPGGPDAMTAVVRDMQRLYEKLEAAPLVTLAEIGATALGGGLELALACDIRIAGSGARFGLPEVTIGAVPGWAGTQRLPRLVGPGRAKHLILTGQPVDAVTAAAWGLVTEVVAPERLAPRALELARRIAENAPTAVQVAKQLADAAAGEGRTTTLESLATGFAAGTDDAREGVAAFRAKRPPRFTGR